MTLTEITNKLIELQKLDPEIQVYFIADHGQDLTKISNVEYSFINKDSEEVHIEDVNHYEPDEIQRIVIIY